MPYRVRKQDCKQTDGGSGSYVVQKKTGDEWKKTSCHTSEDKAAASIRARGMNENKDEKRFRIIIREMIIMIEADMKIEDPPDVPSPKLKMLGKTYIPEDDEYELDEDDLDEEGSGPSPQGFGPFRGSDVARAGRDTSSMISTSVSPNLTSTSKPS